ncbi:DNA damage-regulated autophagy modulator protein 2-like, partial [Sinocyclocheilus grahami]|uniref:DNA damage-regulated autophagy modulator protein 2-like n=1 Tax=Sinocyclocheilus grahami TaxID=75366 RepID=UPI0007ACC223
LGTMYVRHKQVQALISASELGLQLLNYTGLLMGIASTVGMCVVANFQKTDMTSIHLLGAGLTFGPGTLYILFQTGMSYRMQLRFHGRDILWARMAVGMWSLISIITLVSKITLRVQPVLQSNHLYDYPHYEEREHMQHGERSPLLAGAM